MDVCLLHQYEEELTHCKKELADVRNSLLSIDHDDDDNYRETWKERFSTSRYKSRSSCVQQHTHLTRRLCTAKVQLSSQSTSNPGSIWSTSHWLENAQLYYSICHTEILHGKHKITKLIIYSKHLHLLHAGHTLVNSSLSRRYDIVGAHEAVHSVTRSCIVCRHASAISDPKSIAYGAPDAWSSL